MMADAEKSYQIALDEGFNPTGFTAGLANFTDNVPGLGGVGNFIRNDAGDRARQAELQWTDAQLKAVSGAASPEQEVVRNNITFFARPGQNYKYLGDRLEQARETAFGSAMVRAGPASRGITYPSEVGPNDPTTGLPTYPGLSAVVAGAGVSDNGATRNDGPLGGMSGGPSEPSGPRPGDVVTTSQPLAPEDTPASLSAQGYTYDSATDTWKRTRTAEARGWTPESAVAQRDRMNPILRNVDAFVRGAADISSLEFADEIAAGADAAFGQGVGNSFGERYRNNVGVQRAIDEADGRDYGFARNAGEVAGGVASALVAAPRFFGRSALQIANPIIRGGVTMARNALGGAAIAGTAAAGNERGDALSRAQAALKAAPVGAVVGAAAPAVVGAVARPVTNAAQSAGRFLGRSAGQVGEMAGIPQASALTARNTMDPLQAAIDQFPGRAGIRSNSALGQRAAEYRAVGIDPTLSDVVDDSARGVIRAAATRATPARQAARDFADGRVVGLQDRASVQARRAISDDPRSPVEMRSEITTRRNAEADRNFNEVRGQMISPDRGILEALRTPAMKPAIQEAATSALNRGDVDTARLLTDLTDDALDYGADAQITVGMADRIARSLNGRAEAFQRSGNNDAAASYFNIAERLRGGARDQVSGYDAALKAYAQDSGLAAATDLGEKFMTMEADEFARAISKLTPEEADIARAAARRAVERAAGTQGNAAGATTRLASGREQGMRTQALLGEGAADLQNGMRLERQAMDNAVSVNPLSGSRANINAQDSASLAGEAAQAVRNAATGNVPGLATQAIRRFQSRGFSDAQAQALVEAAIDPRRTDDLIRMLQERMSRKEARSLARAVQRNLSSVSGSSSVQN
jgi:hypothetical protein